MAAVRWSKEDLDAHNARQDRLRSGVKAIVEERVQPKPSKYKNVKAEVDGLAFDSKREARRYIELRNAQLAGEIAGLRTQVEFPLIVNGVEVCKYVADFVYFRGGLRGPQVVEDSKGVRTDMYRLKRKLMRACLNIEVIES